MPNQENAQVGHFWYVGPVTNYYRCISCCIPKTRQKRITDTATIIPRNIQIPQASLDNHLRQTAENIVHLLHNKQSTLLPDAHNSTKSALIKIAEILRHNNTPIISPLSQSPKNTPITSKK